MCTIPWKTGCLGIKEIKFLQENFYLNSRVFYSLNIITCLSTVYNYNCLFQLHALNWYMCM